jgi:hypothetical protein
MEGMKLVDLQRHQSLLEEGYPSHYYVFKGKLTREESKD